MIATTSLSEPRCQGFGGGSALWGIVHFTRDVLSAFVSGWAGRAVFQANGGINGGVERAAGAAWRAKRAILSTLEINNMF